jgi:hypothetical protein
MICQDLNSFLFDVVLFSLVLGKFFKISDSEILVSYQDSVECCNMLWYGNHAWLRTDNILHWGFLQCDTRSLHNRSRIVSRYSSAPTFIARVTHFIGKTIHRFYALPMGTLEFLFREVIGRQTLLYLFAYSTVLFVGSCFVLHLCLAVKEI